jgi:hypothetical protein
VQFKDGKSTWIVIGDGPKVGTDPNPLVLGDSGMSEQAITEQQKELLAPDMEKGNVAVICNIHTHPVSAIGLLEDYKVAAQEAQQSGTSTLLLPPSMDDIGISGYDRIFPRVRYETAVEDPSGIWYHRPATVNDLAVRPGILDAYRKYVHVANSFWDYHAGTIKPNISKLSETDLDELLRQLPDYFQQSASKYDSDGDDTVKREARETALSNAITTVQADERISERFITDAKGKELYKQWKEVVVDGDLNKYNRVILAAKALMTDSRGTIPSPESLQEIIDAYLANGDKVRFVTYEEAKSEPPCAGVDYSSSKRK